MFASRASFACAPKARRLPFEIARAQRSSWRPRSSLRIEDVKRRLERTKASVDE